MDLPLNSPDDSVEEWDIGDFISNMFAEEPRHASYNDNPEPSTQIAMPDIAPWTSAPLPASNITDRAASTQSSSGPIDLTTNLISPGFNATNFGIEPLTSGEASRSTQGVIQQLLPDDESFSSTNLDPDGNSATCTEIIPRAGTDADHHQQQASSFNAAQDDTLGLSGPDANLSTTPLVDFDWLAPSTTLEAAAYPQTANATTWEFPPEDGSNSISNMAPPAADLDRVHNPARMPFLPDSRPSFEATMSVTPTGIINPDPAERTSHTSSVLLPPTQMRPNARNHQRHPLSQTPHGIYASILPKQSPSTNPSLVGNQQGPSSPSDASFKTAVVPQAQASAMRGQKRENDVPASYLCEFDSSKSVGFGGDEIQLSKPQKRTRRDTGKVRRSCLRCLFQHIKCSETFPCAQCQQLFQRRANKHSDVMVRWSCCIDADLSKMDFFQQLATLDNDMANTLEGNCTVEGLTTAPSLDQYLQRVKPHAGKLMSAVEKPLHLPHGLSYEGKTPSLAWGFAIAMLAPDYIVVAAKLSDREMRDFVVKISAAFFATTMEMLKDAKSKNLDLEKWSMLNEQLMTLYFLTKYPIFQHRLAHHYIELMRGDTEQRQETLTAKSLHLRLFERDAARRYLNAHNQEGWNHLQEFILHWLEWLRAESTAHGKIMIKLFNLNTLCRMVKPQKSRHFEQVTVYKATPDCEPRDWLIHLFYRAFATFENLRSQIPTNEAVTLEKFLASPSGGLSLPQALRLNANLPVKGWIVTSWLLESTDQAIAARLQRSSSGMPKACKIKRLPKYLESTRGHLKMSGGLSSHIIKRLRQVYEMSWGKL